MGHKMSNESYLERVTHIAKQHEVKKKWILEKKMINIRR
jgi:hypothetical protein